MSPHYFLGRDFGLIHSTKVTKLHEDLIATNRKNEIINVPLVLANYIDRKTKVRTENYYF